MAIADAPAESIDIAGRVGKIDDQKIIAASGRFNEGECSPFQSRSSDARIVTNREGWAVNCKCAGHGIGRAFMEGQSQRLLETPA